MKFNFCMMIMLVSMAAISCKKKNENPEGKSDSMSSFSYSNYNVAEKAESTADVQQDYCDFSFSQPGVQQDFPNVQVIIHNFSGKGEYDISDSDIVIYASDANDSMYWKNYYPYQTDPKASGKITVQRVDERFVAQVDAILLHVSGDSEVSQTRLKAKIDQKITDH